MPRPATPEHMDDPAADPVEIEESFHFIRRVNRWLGGTSTLLAVLERCRPDWPTDRPFRWLDVATGAADIPLAVDRWAQERGLAIECVGLDKMPACLAVGRQATAGHPRVRVVEGDALAPGLGLAAEVAAGGFDLAHTAMFLHHLTEPEIVTVLRSMAGLAPRCVVWNDLLRSTWSRAAIRVATVGMRPFLRDDAILSVEKGFTLDEARVLMEEAGLAVTAMRRRSLLGRFAVSGEASRARPAAPPA